MVGQRLNFHVLRRLTLGAVVKSRWGGATSFHRGYACLALVVPCCTQRRCAGVFRLFYVVSASGYVYDACGGSTLTVRQSLVWYMGLVFFCRKTSVTSMETRCPAPPRLYHGTQRQPTRNVETQPLTHQLRSPQSQMAPTGYSTNNPRTNDSPYCSAPKQVAPQNAPREP